MKRKKKYCVIFGAMLLAAAAVPVNAKESVGTELFTVEYPDGWNYDAEYLSDEEGYCRAEFFKGDEGDSAELSVTVLAQAEEASSFRDQLLAKGIAMEAYADATAESRSFGGRDYAVSGPEYTGGTVCLTRDAAAGISYYVTVSGDIEDPAVQELLEGISFVQKDNGNVDPPWPWEGTPFAPQTAPQMVGTYTITPEFVPFQEAKAVTGIMEHRFVKTGSTLYHLFEDTLTTYEDSAEGMAFVSELALGDEYEYLSAGQSGMLYVSQGIFEVIGIKDGQKAMQTNVDGDLVMHPSGEWGISFWVNSDTQKITNQNGILSSEPWILTGLNDDAARTGMFSMISEVEITEEHILVAGKSADETSDEKIAVYDYEGNQLMALGGSDISDPDCLGSITAMAETPNGIVAADGNMRRINFWTKEGTFIGAVGVRELFGTSYPWLEDMQLLEDGSLLVALTQEREDESADELLFFRLTGF